MNAVPPASPERIEKMFSIDKTTALILLVALWVTVFFTLFAMRALMPAEVALFAVGGAALMLLFNTVAIIAMIRHYNGDKTRIYSLDIHHLEAGRGPR